MLAFKSLALVTELLSELLALVAAPMTNVVKKPPLYPRGSSLAEAVPRDGTLRFREVGHDVDKSWCPRAVCNVEHERPFTTHHSRQKGSERKGPSELSGDLRINKINAVLVRLPASEPIA